MIHFEKQINNNTDSIAFTAKSEGYLMGILFLVPSTVMLLKNKKVYELKIEVNKIFDMNRCNIEYSLYKDFRDFLETTNYYVIEAIDKNDAASIKTHNNLGFAKTDIETKKCIYYKIH